MTGSARSAAPRPFRPGGLGLTDRALAFCDFPGGSRLLDLGCGEGATLRHVRRDYGLEILGLDADPSWAEAGEDTIIASAEAMPLPDASFDGILMECSLSVMADPEAALGECRRVLRPGGRLVVSDLYARGEAARLRGCLGRIERLEDIRAGLARGGFEIELFEDHSEALASLWARLVFERGAASFYAEVGADRAALKAVECGYYLAVAGRVGR